MFYKEKGLPFTDKP